MHVLKGHVLKGIYLGGWGTLYIETDKSVYMCEEGHDTFVIIKSVAGPYGDVIKESTCDYDTFHTPGGNIDMVNWQLGKCKIVMHVMYGEVCVCKIVEIDELPGDAILQ